MGNDYTKEVEECQLCIVRFQDYINRAENIVNKYFSSFAFVIESIDYIGNDLIVYGSDCYEGSSEPTEYKFPIEVLFYSEKRLKQYGEQRLQKEEEAKKRAEAEYAADVERREREELARLKEKYEKNDN